LSEQYLALRTVFDMSFDQHTELQLMEALENEPETSQADLAAQVGVAVGTVNWYIKRWTAKGYVKVKRIGRWRWRYLLTPQGMAEKADLANRYFQASMRIYRQTRAEAKQIVEHIRSEGYVEVVIDAEGDIADIFKLTCTEHGIVARDKTHSADVPVVSVADMKLVTSWPGHQKNSLQ
jgi:DNA-binding MarR family transcriptional regulator